MTETFLAANLLDDLGVNLKVVGTQVVIFVTTFLVLANILFGRVLRHVLRREEELKNARQDVEADRAEAARLKQEYDDNLAKAEQDTYVKMQAIMKDALADAAKTVGRAQDEARKEVAKAGEEILAEKREAKTELRDKVTQLALGVAERVLETKLDPATHGETVRKFVAERS